MSAADGSNSPARPQPLKLLVFAGVPPPVHGQSVMVAALLESLRTDPSFKVVHVDPRLSATHEEIGRWRAGKIFRLVGACARALAARGREGPMVLYYVPAPGKRSALYRDWLVMLFCRPLFSRLILHWHAVGLGEWLEGSGRQIERKVTRLLLGRADTAIVLAEALRADAECLWPKAVSVVPNGIPDPIPTWSVASEGKQGINCLFLGLCTAEKGLFELLDALQILRASPGAPPVCLTVAGSFADKAEQELFLARCAQHPDTLRYVGPVTGVKKDKAFRAADVFCFPTHYRHEAQPLTLIEALAYDLPIVTTRWRAIPAMLPTDGVWVVEPRSPEKLALAILEAAQRRWTPGLRRAHYLSHFTQECHVTHLTTAILKAAEPIFPLSQRSR